MREPVKDLGRIQHMLDMAVLLSDKRDNISIEMISGDRILFYGLSKMVEIIGEAAYMITKEFKSSHPQLPWRQIEGMRHILVHGYYSISSEVLFDVIQNDIPLMIPILSDFVKDLQNS